MHAQAGLPKFTVTSLQRLKMAALITAPADCEVQSVMKFLTAQSIVLIEIHHQLCQIYGHTWLDGQHISFRGSAGRCLIIIHPITWTSCPVISIFSYNSNSCPVSTSIYQNNRGMEISATAVPITGGRLLQLVIFL